MIMGCFYSTSSAITGCQLSPKILSESQGSSQLTQVRLENGLQTACMCDGVRFNTAGLVSGRHAASERPFISSQMFLSGDIW